MKIYEKYIFKEIFLNSVFFYFLFNFLFIFLKLIDFSEKIINGSLSFSSAIFLSFLLVPSFSIFTIPLVCLACILLTFSKFSSNNEILALKSFGISSINLLKLSLFTGIFFFILGVFNNIYLVPISSKIFLKEVKKVLNFARESLKPKTFNSILPSTVIYFKNFDIKKENMEKVFIYNTLNKSSPEAIVAEKGNIDLKNSIFKVNLINGNIFLKKTDEMEIVSFKFYSLKYNIANELSKFNIDLKDKESSINEIRKRITIYKTQGDIKRVNYLLMEIYKRFSLPFTSIIFSILALIFGVQNSSKNPKSWTIFILFAIVFFYYSLIMFSSYLVKLTVIPALLGSWLPNIVTGIIAFLLFYRIKKYDNF